MNNLIKQNENLESYVKNVIFKYCPYVEDRLSILGKTISPCLNIEFSIDKNQSQVIFLFGNSTYKQSIPEQAIIQSVIYFQQIGSIIDFILEDHQVIKSIDLNNNVINLKFAINWTDQSIKGINCGDIGLSLKFNNVELEKQYLYLLFQKYYTYLEQVPSFKIIKNEYIDSIKQSYFSTLDKSQLIFLLNEMSENELRELLYNLDNELFIKYTNDSKQQSKDQKLFLENTNKDN